MLRGRSRTANACRSQLPLARQFQNLRRNACSHMLVFQLLPTLGLVLHNRKQDVELVYMV
jgi:hypothetical protein